MTHYVFTMPTDTELKKRGCPTTCKTCHGYGDYQFGPDYKGMNVHMSAAGARLNFRTKACKVCGANPCPKGSPNEPLKR